MDIKKLGSGKWGYGRRGYYEWEVGVNLSNVGDRNFFEYRVEDFLEIRGIVGKIKS